MSAKLYIVIVGCGRLGGYMAGRLSHTGHSVVVIDTAPDALDALPTEYSGFRIEGDATEYALLKEAKTDKADLVIATTREDNVNLMVAQVARRVFKVPRVMARVFDPRREEVYRLLGVETFSPTVVAGELMLKAIAEPAGPAQ
jgi:trk system potassium uptake protein TrkA